MKLSRIFAFPFYKYQKIFIKNSYIGRINEILLNLISLSWPTLFSSVDDLRFPLKKKFNLKHRNELKLDYKPKSKFEKFMIKLIKIQIPQIYFESFNEATSGNGLLEIKES